MSTLPVADRKRHLREQARRLLASVSDAPALSRELGERFIASDLFRSARTVLAYLPLPGEADCFPIIDAAFADGKAVCAPEVAWDRGVITPVRLRRDSHGCLLTPPGRHGVRGPRRDAAGGDEVNPQDIDLAIVPGLAFDLRGGRLGRGAGFYDRLLPRFPHRTVVCGLCFDAQIVESVPMNEGDAPVNALATDRRLVLIDRDHCTQPRLRTSPA